MGDNLPPSLRPLNEEQIAWLVEVFAKAKARIENTWGTPHKPWVQSRR